MKRHSRYQQWAAIPRRCGQHARSWAASAIRSRRNAGALGRQSWFGRAAYNALWPVLRTVVKLAFRFRLEDGEKLPTGPFILAPVHRSFIDTPIAAMVTRRRMRFMGKESLWESKPLGIFLTFLGGFPVERGTADRSALRAAADVLANGEPLVMFPEGTRRFGRGVRRSDLHEGPAFVAARSDVPIVPVGLGGTDRVLPPGVRIPRPLRIVAVVGDPVHPPPKLGGKIPRRHVHQLTDRLHEELDALYRRACCLAGDDR